MLAPLRGVSVIPSTVTGPLDRYDVESASTRGISPTSLLVGTLSAPEKTVNRPRSAGGTSASE
jgi:hypothetical protein